MSESGLKESKRCEDRIETSELRAGVRKFAFGAFVVTASCAAFVFVLLSASRPSPAFQTQTAESITVEMEDQSVVILAPESALNVEFSEESRVVALLQGQAFFEVMEDPNRFFHVTARDYVIEALGTSFDVHLEDESVTVAVERGMVSVRSLTSREEIRLVQGQSLRGLEGGVIESTDQGIVEMTAWRRGRILLRETALIDAVDRMSRYLKADVAIEDTELREMKLSGDFNAAKPIVGLEAMASSVNAFLEKTSNTLITIRQR